MNAKMATTTPAPASTNDAIAIPDRNFELNVIPGGIKKIKASHRRNDAMSWVAVDEVHIIDGLNPRVHNAAYKARVRAIADSIIANGFKPTRPLIVFVQSFDTVDRICVQDGHTRLAAVHLALSEGCTIDLLPVMFMPNGTSAEDIMADMVLSNEGEPLSTYERAIVVARLSRAGLINTEIGRRLNMTSTNVANLLFLASAPHAIVEMITNGDISATTAVSAMREHGDQAVRVLREAIAERGAAATGAEAEAGASGKGKRRTLSPKAVSPAAAYERACRNWAPDLVRVTTMLRQDPGYESLAPDVRGMIEGLHDQIDNMRAEMLDKFGKAAEKADPAATRGDD